VRVQSRKGFKKSSRKVWLARVTALHLHPASKRETNQKVLSEKGKLKQKNLEKRFWKPGQNTLLLHPALNEGSGEKPALQERKVLYKIIKWDVGVWKVHNLIICRYQNRATGDD
jgi:hypothetical protein